MIDQLCDEVHTAGDLEAETLEAKAGSGKPEKKPQGRGAKHTGAYQGGKSIHGDKIAAEMLKRTKGDDLDGYAELACGILTVGRHVITSGTFSNHVFVDKNPAVIHLMRHAFEKGSEGMPDDFKESEWLQQKLYMQLHQEEPDKDESAAKITALTGFMGFASGHQRVYFNNYNQKDELRKQHLANLKKHLDLLHEDLKGKAVQFVTQV